MKLALVISTLSAFTYVGLNFYFPIYFKETLGFSGQQTGLLLSLMTVTALFTIVSGGIGSDRIIAKRLIMAGLLLSFISYLMLGRAEITFVLMLGVMLSRGIGTNLVRQSMEALIYKLLGQKNAEKAVLESKNTGFFLGTYQAWISFGIGLGMIVTGYLLSWTSFQTLFIVFAAITGVQLVMALRLPQTGVLKIPLLHYQREIMAPHVILFLLIFFLFGQHIGAEQTSYALFLKENLHLSQIKMGYYMAAELLFLAAAALLLGRHHDQRKLSLCWILYLGLLGSGLGQLGMVTPHIWVSVLFRMVHGLGDGAVFLAMRLGIHHFFKIESIGGTSALISFALMSGVTAGSLVYGPLGETLGYQSPLMISGAIVIGLVGLVFWYRHHLREH